MSTIPSMLENTDRELTTGICTPVCKRKEEIVARQVDRCLVDRDRHRERLIQFKQVTIEMYLLNTLMNFLRENHKYYLGYP